MNPIEILRNLRYCVKGQTALEYLLIVVVAIIIVALVWLFMTGTAGNTSKSANSKVTNLLINLSKTGP